MSVSYPGQSLKCVKVTTLGPRTLLFILFLFFIFFLGGGGVRNILWIFFFMGGGSRQIGQNENILAWQKFQIFFGVLDIPDISFAANGRCWAQSYV